MTKLAKTKPESVFSFFEAICNIPHGSGNVEAISNYLVSFAKERNLFVVQDKVKNVIIIKEATASYEEEDAVILQGHMDMVAVKKAESDICMETQGLDLQVDGDFLFAKDTSLGGDDGIAVAYMLALLDATDLSHPRLEAIFTVDEETGMEGAREIDLSILKGKQLLNLDSEEEGILLASCAGGGNMEASLPLEYQEVSGTCLNVCLTGFVGGHSGTEIHKGRGNANVLLARILLQLSHTQPMVLLSMEGGLKDNAIPREANAKIIVEAGKIGTVKSELEALTQNLVKEYAGKESGVEVLIKTEDTGDFEGLTQSVQGRVLTWIVSLPNGVVAMSGLIDGLVETSLNLGIMQVAEGTALLHYSVRSSVSSAREFVLHKIEHLTKLLGGNVLMHSSYPAWEYKENSKLRDKMQAVYTRLHGTPMEVQAIHAGLECGLLSDKIEGLDCVSIGPNMQDIHTTEEKLSISSTQRVWDFVVEFLKEK